MTELNLVLELHQVRVYRSLSRSRLLFHNGGYNMICFRFKADGTWDYKIKPLSHFMNIRDVEHHLPSVQPIFLLQKVFSEGRSGLSHAKFSSD